MRIVVALGGNALLERGQPLTAQAQRDNVRVAAEALAPIAREHELVITHGNGPQVGLLALQGAAYKASEAYPLDVLDAETEGQIGYLIEQELRNILGQRRECASLLTQIEVDPNDPAFQKPTKPIGPVYREDEARKLECERGWRFARDGDRFRRVVASPRPQRIFEIGVIRLLVDRSVIVICAGGGGIPTVRRGDGSLIGVEAVIDKDLASALLAKELGAEVFLMLTDVEAVWDKWGEPDGRRLQRIASASIRRYKFAPGSMGPKIEAACDFVETTGGMAGIGRLADATGILKGTAGTMIIDWKTETVYWD